MTKFEIYNSYKLSLELRRDACGSIEDVTFVSIPKRVSDLTLANIG